MSEEPTAVQPPQAADRKQRDRRIKLVFLVLLLAAAAVIYWVQRQGPKLAGWQSDLPAAIRQANTEGRLLLVFFHESRPNEDSNTSRMMKFSLPQSMVTGAIADKRLIPVSVAMDRSLSSPAAKQYEVRELPTLLILSPGGKILERKTGFVGPAEVQKMILSSVP